MVRNWCRPTSSRRESHNAICPSTRTRHWVMFATDAVNHSVDVIIWIDTREPSRAVPSIRRTSSRYVDVRSVDLTIWRDTCDQYDAATNNSYWNVPNHRRRLKASRWSRTPSHHLVDFRSATIYRRICKTLFASIGLPDKRKWHVDTSRPVTTTNWPL